MSSLTLSESDAPLRERVAGALRDAIREFRLQPGQRLTEREITEGLGVSRTTVREALSELASEGLVTMTPQKGATVATPSHQDAADLYEVRGELEAILVQRFVDRASEDQVATLAIAVEQFRQVTVNFTDFRQLLLAKDEFYRVLLDGAHSPSIAGVLTTIHARLEVIRSYGADRGRVSAAGEEVVGILEAVRGRDSALAERRIREHIRAVAIDSLARIPLPA